MHEPTILDVARAAGVSTASVSNLLNGRFDRMRPATKSLIERAIEELGYRPNHVARQLKTGQTSMIGLLLPTVGNPYFGELAVAVEKAAQAHGLRVIVCNTLRDKARERRALQDLLSFGVRAILVASAVIDPNEARTVLGRGIAVVALDLQRTDWGDTKVDVVTLDNAAATRLAVDHLAILGHRDIAYVTAPLSAPNRVARLSGYEQALRTNDLLGGKLVVVEEGPVGEATPGEAGLAELGGRAACRLAAARQRPTAVVAMNDMIALGIVAGFREGGLSVPDDVSVVGIDDIQLASLTTPALTTIRQPFTELAEAALARLRARMADLGRPGTETVFAPHLIVRASTKAVVVREHDARLRSPLGVDVPHS